MGANESGRWEAVQRRDRRFDGTFVYAVRTTGIYCRPSCTSRRPNRENVAYFDGPQLAERAGFRACLRCQPGAASGEPLLARIAQVCRYLEEPHEVLPSLRELGARFAISPHHLQRQFTRIVGVSPREYADSHRRARFKSQLRGGESVTDALYNAGYGSSSGFYGQAAATLGMSPVTYRKGGESMEIVYTIAPCRLGYLLVGATERGVCTISLGDGEAELDREPGRGVPWREARTPAGGLRLLGGRAARIDRRPAGRAGPAAGYQGHRLPAESMGGPACNPPRQHPLLQPDRRGHRTAQRGACRGRGMRKQPGSPGHPLPPGGPGGRCSQRLSLGHGAQGGTAGSGGRIGSGGRRDARCPGHVGGSHPSAPCWRARYSSFIHRPKSRAAQATG